MTIKQQIQADYMKIDNFNGDWVLPLMKKYNMTREQILANIKL